MAKIILSSKSKPMLSLNGFLYTRHSNNKKGDRQYWRCTERDRCNARCTTDAFDPEDVIKDGTGDHCHPEIDPEIQAKEAVQRIKRRAEDHPNEPPQQIIARELTHEHDPEVLADLPERQTPRRFVNRTQNRARPSNPGDLNSLHIIDPYTSTIQGERFLQYDSGSGSDSRLLIFTTSKNLELLCSSSTIFSDGTFKTAPDMFTQMFTVHGTFRQHLFPFVYALTTRRDAETYGLLYRELKRLALENGLSFQPESMMSDFELANMNAAREQFPRIRIKGCLFHFSQNIWKNTVQNGLQVAYRNDAEVRKQIKHLFGLPFVPVQDIPAVFDDILEDVTRREIAAVYKTIKETYVHVIVARGRRRAVPPRFPPEVWCVHDAVLHDEHRTNNMVEGFHNKFEKAAQVHHTKIWRFLDTIRKDQNTNEQLQVQLRRGHRKIRQPRLNKSVL